MEIRFSPLLVILITLVLLPFHTHAEVGSAAAVGYRPSVAPPPICTNEPDSSVGLVERVFGGRTIVERALGDEIQCLQRNGLAKSGSLEEQNYTRSGDLNSFYDQCTFIQMPGEFRDIEAITERVHLENRDRLINGLWQDIANRSSRQLSCRIDTITQYQNNPTAKTNLNRRVEEKFNSVIERVQGLILSKRRIDSRNRQDVFRRIDCSGLAWFMCNSIVSEKNKVDLSQHEMAIAQELAKVPFGYEPDVADALVKMAENGSFDERLLGAALNKSQERYRKLNGYYTQRAPDTSVGNGIYCIDREFKEKAVTSGVAKKLIDSYPETTMGKTQKIVLQCKLDSKYKVAEANLDTAANITFMVAGATAAVMTAVPSGGGSLAAFGAVTSAGLSAASFSYQVQKAHEACTKKDFVVSPDGNEVCNPEEDFNKEMSENKLSDCLKESAWAALEALPIPFDIVTVVRARRGLRITDLVNDAKIAEEYASLSRTGRPSAAALDAEGNIPIIVQGKRPKRYFNEREYAQVEAGLRQRGINYVDEIPPGVFRTLSPDEKLFVIERMGMPLTPDKARRFKRFFESHPDGTLSSAEMNELRSILAEGLPSSRAGDAGEILSDLEEKGFFRNADAPPPASRVVDEANGQPVALTIREAEGPVVAASPQRVVPPASPARTEQIRANVSRLDEGTLTTRGAELSRNKEPILDDLLGAGASREEVEIAIDVISGNAHKDLYRAGTRGSSISVERYEQIENMIKSNPNYARYRDEMEELIEIRIRQGNKLADEEWAALKAEHPKVREGEPIDCSQLSAIYPGSFPANGKCRRVEFDEEVSRRYCYCGAMGQVGFNWLTKCPGSKSEFRNLTSYIDDFALPHASSPEMCVRVSVPKGKQCYLGPTGATLSGFGGASQLLCINRAFSDRTRSAAEAGRLQGAGGDLAVRPEAWSPFSTFDEFQDIVQDAATACTNICDISKMRDLRARYDAAKRALQARVTNPSEVQRLTEEIERFDDYIAELGNGRRKYPYEIRDGERVPGPLSTPSPASTRNPSEGGIVVGNGGATGTSTTRTPTSEVISPPAAARSSEAPVVRDRQATPTRTRASGTAAQQERALSDLEELINSSPSIGRHKLIRNGDEVTLEIGILNGNDIRMSRAIQRAVSTGAITKIDAKEIINPRILSIVTRFGDLAPSDKPLKVVGSLQFDELIATRQYSARGQMSPFGSSDIMNSQEIADFDRAVERLGIPAACRQAYSSPNPLACRGLKFTMDAKNSSSIQWTAIGPSDPNPLLFAHVRDGVTDASVVIPRRP